MASRMSTWVPCVNLVCGPHSLLLTTKLIRCRKNKESLAYGDMVVVRDGKSRSTNTMVPNEVSSICGLTRRNKISPNLNPKVHYVYPQQVVFLHIHLGLMYLFCPEQILRNILFDRHVISLIHMLQYKWMIQLKKKKNTPFWNDKWFPFFFIFYHFIVSN